ncbi:hypothetical protein HYQ46_001829 [Verticillium longisporum]|nr:hypothetical protein HYQ46_001829 [Verticillium longisporum]
MEYRAWVGLLYMLLQAWGPRDPVITLHPKPHSTWRAPAGRVCWVKIIRIKSYDTRCCEAKDRLTCIILAQLATQLATQVLPSTKHQDGAKDIGVGVASEGFHTNSIRLPTNPDSP